MPNFEQDRIYTPDMLGEPHDSMYERGWTTQISESPEPVATTPIDNIDDNWLTEVFTSGPIETDATPVDFSPSVFPIGFIENNLVQEGLVAEGDFRNDIPDVPVTVHTSEGAYPHAPVYIKGIQTTIFIPMRNMPHEVRGGEQHGS